MTDEKPTQGDAAEVSKTLIEFVTPAREGWVLAFIVIVGIIVGSDMWISIKTLEANKEMVNTNRAYFDKVEANRASANRDAIQVYADQLRRSQEVIRSLSESIARESERTGDAAVEYLKQSLPPAGINQVERLERLTRERKTSDAVQD